MAAGENLTTTNDIVKMQIQTKKKGSEEARGRMGVVVSPVVACAFVACIIAVVLARSLPDSGLSELATTGARTDGETRAVGLRGPECLGYFRESYEDPVSTLGLHASGAVSTCTGTTPDDLLVSDRATQKLTLVL